MSGEELIEKISSLDINQIAIECLKSVEDLMVEKNREQLSEGKLTDDSLISPPYSESTKKRKRSKSGLSSVTDVVTTFDTGEHYSKIFANTISPDIINFGSTAEVSKKLSDQYETQSGNLYGLNRQSVSEIIEAIKPIFLEKIHKKVNV